MTDTRAKHVQWPTRIHLTVAEFKQAGSETITRFLWFAHDQAATSPAAQSLVKMWQEERAGHER